MSKTDLKKHFLKFHQSLPKSLQKYPLYFGVSAGLDSSVLATVAWELRERLPPIHWVHVNYGLRIPDCDEDEAFLRRWAEELRVPFHARRFRPDTKPANLQNWAREERFKFFSEVIAKSAKGQGLLCLAHHQQDQAETVLLRLTRGASLQGLAGMSAFEEISSLSRKKLPSSLLILRPFLDVSHEAIEQYACSHSVSYREDVSNQSDLYQRNRMRHHVIPLLLQENPRAIEALCEFSQKASRAADALNNLAQTWLKKNLKKKGKLAWLSMRSLKKLPEGLAEEVLVSFVATMEVQPQALSKILPQILQYLAKPGPERVLVLKHCELLLKGEGIGLKMRDKRVSFH